jgi:hypothetical protein
MKPAHPQHEQTQLRCAFWPRIFALVSSFLLTPACVPAEDASAPTTEVKSTESEASETPSPTPSLDVEIGQAGLLALPLDKALGATKEALTGAALASGESSGTSLYPGALQIGSALVSVNPLSSVCNASGSAKVEESEAAGIKSAKHAFCDIAMEPDGPDTTRGGISRVQSVLCSVRDNIKFDGTTQEIEIDFLNAECWNETFRNMTQSEVDSGQMSSSKAKLNITGYDNVESTVGNAGYDKRIKIADQDLGGGFSYDIQFTQTETELSAAILLAESSDTHAGDIIAISMLQSNGSATIRYEGRFGDMQRSNSPVARHLRVLAKGPFDSESMEFESIDSLEYLFLDVYGTTQLSSQNISAQFRSVRGNPADGYVAIGVNAGDSLNESNYATSDSGSSHCYGDGNCVGNDGIKMSSSADLAFAKTLLIDSTQDYVSANQWFRTIGPLRYDQVSLAGTQQ